MASGTTDTFDRDSIISHMVGRSLSEELFYHKHSEDGARQPGKKVLSVENLSMGSMVRNTSFSLCEGQVTGLFGLIGSGRTETAKIISGVLKRNFFHGGELRYLGRSVRYRQPHKAVMYGIVYVTEDRKAEGFFEQMSFAENIYMGENVADAPPFERGMSFVYWRVDGV